MTNFNIGEYCFNKTGKLVGCKKVILQKEKKDHKIAQKLYNDLKKTLGEKYHGTQRIKRIIIK